MANGFALANRSMQSDNGKISSFVIATTVLFLGAWVSWAFYSRVTRYEMSDSARLEIDSAAYPIQVSASGRVTAVHLRLGSEVKAGEVLLEFDNQGERLTLEQERTHLEALKPQLSALRAEVEAERGGQADERQVLRASQTGAQAQLEQANTEAALADEEWSRASRLQADKLISEAEAARAKANAQSKHSAADNLKSAASRLGPELDVRERDREIKSKQTWLDIAKMEAEMATSAATVKKLEYEMERRQVRAPITGRLAECAALHPGSHVTEGEQVGIILPTGRLQVIAQFQPSAALGKVHTGQTAILRLQGFPWAQYGIVRTRVSRVADEIRDGKVRVELAVNEPIPSRIPAQHGLPGSVEVEIEHVSPATLILRSAGEVVGAR